MTTRTFVYGAARVSRRSTGLARSSRGPIARRGAVIVWVAVLGVVLIGFVGLAMDAGVVFLAGSHFQIAADAGSLAGARLVRDDLNKAREAARVIAFENKAVGDSIILDPNGDIVIGHFYRFADDRTANPRCPVPPCFFPQTDPTDRPNAVKVNARRTNGSFDDKVPLVFGPVFNVKGVKVKRTAIAINAGSTGAGLLVLCPDCECALDFRGSTDLVVESAPGYGGDAGIQVNSDHDCAVCGRGSDLELTAPETNIVGSDPGYCFTGNPTLHTYMNPDSPPLPDPLAGLPAPTRGAPHNPGIIDHTTIVSVPTTFSPGYYPGGIRIEASGDFVILEPGVYVVDGEGLYVNGGNLKANGVMFYVIDDPAVIGDSKVYLGGNGIIDVTPSADESDPYWGISIFQARDNRNEATIIGTGTMNLQGTYYFPKNKLRVSGVSDSLGIQVIAYEVGFFGSVNFKIQYDGRFSCPECREVFLVQ